MRSNIRATKWWATKWHLRRAKHQQNHKPFAPVPVHIPSWTWSTRRNHVHLIQSTRFAARVSVVRCPLYGLLGCCSAAWHFDNPVFNFHSAFVQHNLHQWGGCRRNTIVSVVNSISICSIARMCFNSTACFCVACAVFFITAFYYNNNNNNFAQMWRRIHGHLFRGAVVGCGRPDQFTVRRPLLWPESTTKTHIIIPNHCTVVFHQQKRNHGRIVRRPILVYRCM